MGLLADLGAVLEGAPAAKRPAMATIREAARRLDVDTLEYVLKAALVVSRVVLSEVPSPTEAGDAVPG
jgi:hypothetical protein